MSLTLGALAVLAANEPAPPPASTVPASVRELEPPVKAAGIDAATAAPTSVPRPRPPAIPTVASGRSRPHVAVVEPSPGVAPRLFAGAKAVFLGDSYTAGWNGAGLGRRGWPAIVARARDWRTVNLAVAGTGFINPGWTDQPVGSRVAAAIRQKPDVVFIASGHNDSRWSGAATAAAADRVIERLHRALPDAVLVIVAPIWPSGSPPSRCLALRDHLRRTARSVDAVFIDPLAEGWFAGAQHRMIGRDGIHPTDAGHRHMAEQILAGIAAAE